MAFGASMLVSGVLAAVAAVAAACHAFGIDETIDDFPDGDAAANDVANAIDAAIVDAPYAADGSRLGDAQSAAWAPISCDAPYLLCRDCGAVHIVCDDFDRDSAPFDPTRGWTGSFSYKGALEFSKDTFVTPPQSLTGWGDHAELITVRSNEPVSKLACAFDVLVDPRHPGGAAEFATMGGDASTSTGVIERALFLSFGDGGAMLLGEGSGHGVPPPSEVDGIPVPLGAWFHVRLALATGGDGGIGTLVIDGGSATTVAIPAGPPSWRGSVSFRPTSSELTGARLLYDNVVCDSEP